MELSQALYPQLKVVDCIIRCSFGDKFTPALCALQVCGDSSHVATLLWESVKILTDQVQWEFATDPTHDPEQHPTIAKSHQTQGTRSFPALGKLSGSLLQN